MADLGLCSSTKPDDLFLLLTLSEGVIFFLNAQNHQIQPLQQLLQKILCLWRGFVRTQQHPPPAGSAPELFIWATIHGISIEATPQYTPIKLEHNVTVISSQFRANNCNFIDVCDRKGLFILWYMYGVHVRRTCTPHMCEDCLRCTCALFSACLKQRPMNVYTMIHVRRTPVRRTCTAYMYHSVNTL